ncbi:hypothetical protein DPEC_G00332230 [Dallia pectoralis]|uniref:Uncharacterized protein n=1 Tax=Dallia pectoralis TaxID=75939 RepID=A0ACC2F631_DALPE|nr:hypothetical protein DPEC_G00332230 [Dallia pectoralis]
MEGLKDVSARHDRTYQALLEQFQTLSARLTPTMPPANPSNMVSEPAPLAAAVPSLVFLAIRIDSRLRERERERMELHGVPVILGLSWLQRHNPTIDWSTGVITGWRSKCLARCLRSAQLTLTDLAGGVQGALDLSAVPNKYMGLQEVFSQSRALSDPPSSL